MAHSAPVQARLPGTRCGPSRSPPVMAGLGLPDLPSHARAGFGMRGLTLNPAPHPTGLGARMPSEATTPSRIGENQR